MSAMKLLADSARLGIRLEAHGDRLRYAPRSAVTPDLADRLKAHKGELLAILRQEAPVPDVVLTDAAEGHCDDLDLWAEDLLPDGPNGWPVNSFEPPDPCPECGMLEMWQTAEGNWRCERCDPPTTAWRLLELVARLQPKTDNADT